MISIVTPLQVRTKTLKSKESKMFTNRSYGVYKRKVYYNQKKGGEQEFFEAYCELLRNETGEEFEI